MWCQAAVAGFGSDGKRENAESGQRDHGVCVGGPDVIVLGDVVAVWRSTVDRMILRHVSPGRV